MKQVKLCLFLDFLTLQFLVVLDNDVYYMKQVKLCLWIRIQLLWFLKTDLDCMQLIY